jgi:hypothetical protein
LLSSPSPVVESSAPVPLRSSLSRALIPRHRPPSTTQTLVPAPTPLSASTQTGSSGHSPAPPRCPLAPCHRRAPVRPLRLSLYCSSGPSLTSRTDQHVLPWRSPPMSSRPHFSTQIGHPDTGETLENLPAPPHHRLAREWSAQLPLLPWPPLPCFQFRATSPA